MVKPEILQEKPVSMAELKDEIAKIRKKSEKINFRAEKTEEYLNQFTILSSKKAAELKEKLEKLKIPRFKDEHIIKLIDLMPASLEEVKRDILARDEKTLNREIAPLRQAEDAVRIDTTHLSIDEVVKKILALAESKRQERTSHG